MYAVVSGQVLYKVRNLSCHSQKTAGDAGTKGKARPLMPEISNWCPDARWDRPSIVTAACAGRGEES